jgi:hypothetical protein
MTAPSPSLTEPATDDACLEVARASFLARFVSGRQVNVLITATVLLSVLTAGGMAALERWGRELSTAQHHDWTIIGCLSMSVLFGVLQQYSALRVAIDVRIFRYLQQQAQVWSARSAWQKEHAGRFNPETVLATAIQSIKSASPTILAGPMQNNRTKHDPLDPYRRTARLYYRQIYFAISQIAFFWIGLIVLVLWH